MQSTRQAILDYLRMHREATVRDLSRELALTTTGIRQHLAILEQDGLVAFRDLKGRVGRPALAYRLTDAGEALYPKAYGRLAVALLEAAAEVCPDGLQERLVVAAAGRLATPLPDASAGSLHARAETIAEHLRAEGNVVELEDSAREARIVQYTCPYLDAARVAPSVCEMDVCALKRATGCAVQLTESRPRGSDRCVFRLTLPAAN